MSDFKVRKFKFWILNVRITILIIKFFNLIIFIMISHLWWLLRKCYHSNIFITNWTHSKVLSMVPILSYYILFHFSFSKLFVSPVILIIIIIFFVKATPTPFVALKTCNCVKKGCLIYIKTKYKNESLYVVVWVWVYVYIPQFRNGIFIIAIYGKISVCRSIGIHKWANKNLMLEIKRIQLTNAYIYTCI